jgi:hypothetical protein
MIRPQAMTKGTARPPRGSNRRCHDRSAAPGTILIEKGIPLSVPIAAP